VLGEGGSRYENLQIAIASLSGKQKIVKEIEILEVEIATAQDVIDNMAEKLGILKNGWSRIEIALSLYSPHDKQFFCSLVN